MAGWGALIVATLSLAGPDAQAAGLKPLYSESRAPLPPPTVSGLPDLSHLAESALPAVVGVITTAAAPPGAKDEALRDLFDKLNDGPRRGIGSGFVIQRDGWVVTNAHVVEGAASIEVDLGGGRRLAAKVIGADAESDVALLKVEADRPLSTIPLGDSDRVLIAEWVLVIGSPFGLDHSVTLGIVSHTGRADISPVGRPGTYDFIQTDASINPGNSGGPVLNLRGEVIGIATAVNATGQGIGFAIPINMVKEVIGQLRQTGKVVRSWLGVAVREPATQDTAPSGVVVTEVAAGGPAAGAGMKVGDVITGFEGHAIRTPARLRWYVSTAGVGRSVEVRLKRGAGPEQAVRVSLAEVPAAEQARAHARAMLGDD
ncbi:MAG TPA: trypsin-like peptidase domain-containing protein [Anaeromyxobacter sp.]